MYDDSSSSLSSFRMVHGRARQEFDLLRQRDPTDGVVPGMRASLKPWLSLLRNIRTKKGRALINPFLRRAVHHASTRYRRGKVNAYLAHMTCRGQQMDKSVV